MKIQFIIHPTPFVISTCTKESSQLSLKFTQRDHQKTILMRGKGESMGLEGY